MGAKAFDRVYEVSSTSGTSDMVLSGSAPGQFEFDGHVGGTGSGNPFFYHIQHAELPEWEIGEGYLDATTKKLVRNTVIASSKGTSKVDFSQGYKHCMAGSCARQLNRVDSPVAASYSTRGSIVGKVSIRDDSGTHVGYAPLYSSIS